MVPEVQNLVAYEGEQPVPVPEEAQGFHAYLPTTNPEAEVEEHRLDPVLVAEHS